MKIIYGVFVFIYEYAGEIGGGSVCFIALTKMSLTYELMNVLLSLLVSILSGIIVNVVKPYVSEWVKKIKSKFKNVKRHRKKTGR